MMETITAIEKSWYEERRLESRIIHLKGLTHQAWARWNFSGSLGGGIFVLLFASPRCLVTGGRHGRKNVAGNG